MIYKKINKLPNPSLNQKLKSPKLLEAPKSNFVQKFLIIYSLITLVTLVFAVGFVLGKAGDSPFVKSDKIGEVKNTNEIPDFLTEDVDFKQFWKVWEYVKNNYVSSDITETQLFYGALSGVVNSLGDPYSVYFDPEISERFAQELSGSFEGIGAEIGIRDNRLTIIAPLPGTPAEQSGLLAGDIVISIDEESAVNIALDYAVSIIRGPKGEEVVLTILREGEDTTRDISIIRDTIEIDSVRFSRKGSENINGEAEDEFILEEGDIAYVELLYFNENTLADWNKTIQKVLSQNPKGIILDLRNNPGGFLNTAIEIAGEWVNGDLVVSERLRDGTEVRHRANRQARFDTMPTVVLVNGGSASGSEIVAGALQDYGLATIVGETTFGKGSVQDLKRFKDGSSIKLTIAEWFTPNGNNINEEGIKPDVEVERTREQFENDEDPQFDKALEILQQN